MFFILHENLKKNSTLTDVALCGDPSLDRPGILSIEIEK